MDTFGDPTVVDDTDNLDSDSITDKYLTLHGLILWVISLEEIYLQLLASLSFSSSKEGLDELTGESKESKINFTSKYSSEL